MVFHGKCEIHDHTVFCFDKISDQVPTITFGRNVVIGKWNDFGVACGVTFGDYVLTAPYVHYTDRNHGFEDINKPIQHQKTTVKGPIRIGNETWIGFGAQIMSGVTIGKHCVIAAGAVVTKDIPDWCVAGGNPVKILKRYNFDTQQWEKV